MGLYMKIGLSLFLLCIYCLYLWLRILAVKADSSRTLEKMPILLKKAKKDFYSVIPIIVIFMLMILFNVITDNFK